MPGDADQCHHHDDENDRTTHKDPTTTHVESSQLLLWPEESIVVDQPQPRQSDIPQATRPSPIMRCFAIFSSDLCVFAVKNAMF